MKYILHDTSASEDEKLSELYIKFGYEGVGLFWAILEKLGKQEKPIKTVVIKKQLNVGKKLEKVWSFLEETALISSNNGETFNEKLLKFAENYKIKSEKTKERISQWRENQQDKKNVTSSEQVGNASKVNRSKVKRKKESVKEKTTVADAQPTLEFPSENFKALWERWVAFKKEQLQFTFKSLDTQQTGIKKLIKLSGGDEALALEIVEQSIEKAWSGLFALKNDHPNFNRYQQNGSSQPPTNPQDTVAAKFKQFQ